MTENQFHNFKVFRRNMRGKDLSEVRRNADVLRRGPLGLMETAIAAVIRSDLKLTILNGHADG